MFGHRASGLLVSLLAVLAILPLGSAWSIFGTRATPGKPLNDVLASEKNLSTYYNLVKEYPDILLQLPSYDGVTLVAPNDEAFDKFGDWDPKNKSLVTTFLEYHILQGTVATKAIPIGISTFATTLLTNKTFTNVTGGQQMIINKGGDNIVVFTSGLGSRSTVVKSDLFFSGGLIQIVDSLMVPPARLEPTTRDAYKDLQSFLGALYVADLVSEFADAPDVTILAPRNAAFQLIAGTLADLSKEDLANILRYHLIPNVVLPSTGFKNSTTFTTAAKTGNSSIHVYRSGNNMYFDRAQLLQPDILIANGVVHIIDAVMNPDASTVTPDPAIGTQAPVFPVTGSRTATGAEVPVPFTSAFPCTTECPVGGKGGGGGEKTSAGGGGAVVTRTTSSTGVRTESSSGVGAVMRVKCTGLPAVVAGGLLVGGMGMEIVGLV